MRMSRRAVLYGIGGGVDYSYTGTYDSYGDTSHGYLVLKTSGTLSIKGTVDLCLVGGGGKGAQGSKSGYGSGGAGGAGGYVQNHVTQELNGDYAVTIGAGSTSTAAGGVTSVSGSYTANGGTSAQTSSSVTGRGTSGNGGTKGAYSTSGEDGIFPWNDATNFSAFRVSGCGGGAIRNTIGTPGSGGAGGGGNGGGSGQAGTAGSANTGGGGGGGNGGDAVSSKVGGNGGSGVVLVRWGY